jgi:hypothetical protein
MKLQSVLIREKHPVGELARSKFSVDQGDELDFEAGLLTIKTKTGREVVTPVHNVAWMERAPADAKGAKK